jgi:hypothetical protein
MSHSFISVEDFFLTQSDNQGFTSLMVACSHGAEEAVALLVRLGVDLNQTGFDYCQSN